MYLAEDSSYFNQYTNIGYGQKLSHQDDTF
jgi:hypothetical protein